MSSRFDFYVSYDENSRNEISRIDNSERNLKLRREAWMDIFMAGGICIYEETDRFLTSWGGGGGRGREENDDVKWIKA